MKLERRHLMLAAGASVVAAATTAARAQEHSGLLKTLFELEVGSWQFTKDANVPALRDYLADGAMLIFVDGTRYTKAQFLKALPTFGLKSFNVDSKSAELMTATPDVATLLYRVSYTTDKPFTVQAANTYVKRHGKWVSLLYQETPAK